MSEREIDILNKLKEALPNMSEFDKGYLLGKAESNMNCQEKENGTETEK